MSPFPLTVYNFSVAPNNSLMLFYIMCLSLCMILIIWLRHNLKNETIFNKLNKQILKQFSLFLLRIRKVEGRHRSQTCVMPPAADSDPVMVHKNKIEKKFARISSRKKPTRSHRNKQPTKTWFSLSWLFHWTTTHFLSPLALCPYEIARHILKYLIKFQNATQTRLRQR